MNRESNLERLQSGTGAIKSQTILRMSQKILERVPEIILEEAAESKIATTTGGKSKVNFEEILGRLHEIF